MGLSTFAGAVRSLGGFFTQGPKANVSIVAPALTLDLTYAGKLLRVNNPVAQITLPPINANPDPKSSGPGPDPNTQNNQGVTFTFFIETAATGAAVLASGADKIVGSAIIQGATLGGFNATPATTNKISLNGGTTGGAVGTLFTLQAVAAGKWLLRDANLVGVGAPATPFN